MAVTITRTDWIDDDGSGTTGTVLNNAVKTDLYNQIDAALAKVAQLAGGNNFTGAQGITGAMTVTGNNVSIANAAGATVVVNVRNPLAGAGNYAELSLGNDTQPRALILQSYASNYASSGIFQANGTLLMTQGAGGLALGPFDSAPLRPATNGLERMRIAATGEVCINTPTNVIGGNNVMLALVHNPTTGHYGFVIQNADPANSTFFEFFLNSTGGTCGSIQQTGASAVAYNTASDARLKDDAGRATDLSALRAVVVHDFTWKADGIRDRGIFAQDAHALYPRAVSKGDDDTTESGTLAHPWQTDYSKFVPDLIVGWQQHDAELTALRAELATLKGLN